MGLCMLFFIKSVWATWKPLVTERQKANRVTFAKDYANWDIEKCRKVLLTGEATFKAAEANSKGWRRSEADPESRSYGARRDVPYVRKRERRKESEKQRGRGVLIILLSVFVF